MSSNQYVTNSGAKNELSIREQLIIEAIKLHGIDVQYIPRDRVVVDDVINETLLAKFGHAYSVEMRVETAEGYQPTSVFMSNLGLSISDNVTVTFAVSSFRFAQEVPDESQPREGSLIYDPASKQLFEIKSVDTENPMRNRNRAPVFLLQTELYKSAQEDVSLVDLIDIDGNVPEELVNETPTDFDVDVGPNPTDPGQGDNWNVSDDFDTIHVPPVK